MATTPTTSTTTPPSTPVIHGPLNIEYLNESWCELQYKSGCSSTGSISHLNHSINPEVLEKLLQEAQKETLILLPDINSMSLSSTYITTSPNSNDSVSLQSPPQLKSSDSSSSILIAEILSSPSSLSATYKPDKPALNNNHSPILDVLYDYDGDDDVDLEYIKDDTDESDETVNIKKEDKNKSLLEEVSKVGNHQHCKNCMEQQKQIEMLLERQLFNEKQLQRLRRDYEDKLLHKSPQLTDSNVSSTLSSPSPTPKSVFNSNNTLTNTTSHLKSYTDGKRSPMSSSSSYSSASFCKDEQKDSCFNVNNFQTNEENDWMRYWSSRPQKQPPKEWNFVHPNSCSKNKLNDLRDTMSNDNTSNDLNSFKLLTKENIGKLIFTHMASFIVGATLMFLVLRRHLNIRNSLYYI